MRPVRRPPQRQSLARPLALVLAVVCLVQLHMLMRPRRGSGGASSSSSGGWLSQRLWHQRQLIAQNGGGGGGQALGWEAQMQQAGAEHAGQAGDPIDVGQAYNPDPNAAALATVRGAPIAFVSFANGAFNDFIANWVLSVRRMGLPFLVGALDKDMAAKATEQGWPHLDVSALVHSNASFFRNNFGVFRNMGATKVQLVLTMLEDLGVETVVVSDSDTAWLHDPSEYFDKHPQADWFISTDCLSHEIEVAWQPRHNQPRCGHIPGNGWGRAFNTGVFAVRNRQAARETLALWRDILLDPSKATTITRNNVTLGVTDQLALNMLLEQDSAGGFKSAPEDPRILLLRNGTLRLHPLPVLLFPSGHVAFVQRLPWRHGVDPYVVHATFQRFSTQMHRVGKRGRFREFGMWFLDGPQYYSADQRYLTYDNDVVRVVSQLSMAQFPAGVPLLLRHLTAMSYQLALFRDAFAAATMLNRTLVLPKSWCWCDYDWTPHVLEKCKIRGSDTKLPFECPADFVFHIPWMEDLGVNYRMPGFLEHPELPEGLRRWQASVQMVAAKPAQLSMPAANGSAAAAGADTVAAAAPGVLWPGMSQAELEASLQKISKSAVISIRGMQPGLLSGFTSQADAQAFDVLYKNSTRDLYWCCAAEGKLEWSAFVYEKPVPFATGLAPWKPPVLTLPKWCDIPLGPPKLKENTEYKMYPNHPCQFLRNETAAQIAGSLY